MMTLERAITLASSTDNGELNDLWREVVAVLVAEVGKNDNPAAIESIDEPQGPLPASILADTADAIADELGRFADELNMHHVRWEKTSENIRLYPPFLVELAKQLRADSTIEVSWEESQK